MAVNVTRTTPLRLIRGVGEALQFPLQLCGDTSLK
jgi:hypothetical protein